MKDKGKLTDAFTAKTIIFDALALWGWNDQTLVGLINEDAIALGMSNLSDTKQ